MAGLMVAGTPFSGVSYGGLKSQGLGCMSLRDVGVGRVSRRGRGVVGLRVSATLESDVGSRRLVDVVRRLPRIARTYFKDPMRRALFGGIAILGGFYVAQTISLSFGALGVNDVIAAAMCVLFTEYITRFTRTRKKISFSVALVNNFKMGFTYGLFIDAFKLAS
ncbi:hypothetical protein KC19_8G062100 [Ceratodon purpureus]|uniref:Ycf20-like protein n=1 Tax=Ceratodon purpureus TaxID=3225 RepID=A0A8T0GVZ1_CERPU|nr:hypothetical protein KC19_8G062100 [Ceratodon purpureus]